MAGMNWNFIDISLSVTEFTARPKTFPISFRDNCDCTILSIFCFFSFSIVVAIYWIAINHSLTPPVILSSDLPNSIFAFLITFVIFLTVASPLIHAVLFQFLGIFSGIALFCTFKIVSIARIILSLYTLDFKHIGKVLHIMSLFLLNTF